MRTQPKQPGRCKGKTPALRQKVREKGSPYVLWRAKPHVLGEQSLTRNEAEAVEPEPPGFSFISDTIASGLILIRSLRFSDPRQAPLQNELTQLTDGLCILWESELGLSAKNNDKKP